MTVAHKIPTFSVPKILSFSDSHVKIVLSDSTLVASIFQPTYINSYRITTFRFIPKPELFFYEQFSQDR